jgi:hypothetical protein
MGGYTCTCKTGYTGKDCEIRKFFKSEFLLFKNNHFVINLKHHGFIIAANNMGQLIDITKNLQFRFREIGVEFIE